MLLLWDYGFVPPSKSSAIGDNLPKETQNSASDSGVVRDTVQAYFFLSGFRAQSGQMVDFHSVVLSKLGSYSQA